MAILVTGARGQLGADVLKVLAEHGIEHKGVGSEDFDITDESAVAACLKAYKPKCVIHCAAYTLVDAAEDNAELCMRVNSGGTENIARACLAVNSEMVYISTDYVFDGKGDVPYEINAPKAPLQVYGHSKLGGEEKVLQYLDKYYIVRTSWVYGKNGSNFVKTMLRLAQDRDIINVVEDQIGSPTYAPDLAALLCEMAMSGKYGTYHATNEGICSWAEFAQEIMRLGGNKCKISPIPSEQYPTKATRPKNSRLSKASLDSAGFARLPDWHDALERYLDE